jgi:carbon storage regulator CsrA
MLVLSRKAGERIMVGENIAVVISRISGNRVTIGIEAPSGVKIVRGELGPLEEVAVAAIQENGKPQAAGLRNWRSSHVPATAK